MENNNKTPLGQIVALIILLISFCMILYGVLSLDSIHIFNNGTERDENYSNDVKKTNENNNNNKSNPEKLKEISNKFNELNSIKDYTKDGTMTIKSTSTDNKILVTVLSDKTYEFDFNLNGNILEKTVGQNDAFFYTFYGAHVATAKAVLDGYDEQTVLNTINDTAQSLSLQTNGIEILPTADNGVSFKIDISKKITLPDNSSRYIMIEDIKEFDELIGKMGTVNAKVGNMAYYYKHEPEDDAQELILIAEPKELTELTYKSLLSFIEYLYGTEEATSFRANFPQITNKTFSKYQITLNPTNEEYNTYYNDNYKVLELIIKK